MSAQYADEAAPVKNQSAHCADYFQASPRGTPKPRMPVGWSLRRLTRFTSSHRMAFASL